MRVRFKGSRENGEYEFGWTGIESYSIKPLSWKEVVQNYLVTFYNDAAVELEREDLGKIKKRIIDTLSALNVKEQKEFLIEHMEALLEKGCGLKKKFENYFIDAPEFILKKLMLEEEFSLAVLELVDKNVRLFVTENDWVDISEEGKTISCIKKEI